MKALINDIIMIGGFSEMIELCEENGYKIYGIVDSNPITLGKEKYNVIGDDTFFLKNSSNFDCNKLIITPDKPLVRKRIVRAYGDIFLYPSIFSKNSKVSKYANIGGGVVVQYGVNISSNVKIYDFVKVNTFANIMHDSIIGEFSTIAPNAVILGNVTIGSEVYIGANSTILPGVNIGHSCIIGAGSVVTKDIPPNSIVVGIPARDLKLK